MVIVGLFQLFEGIAAIAQDQFFVLSNTNYAYEIDTTAWGWIHLGIGIVVALTGLFLFTGATVARILGIAIATISAVSNFFFLPYYPVWSLLIIALNIFVIWAIANARRSDLVEGREEMMGAGAYAGERTQYGERWPQTNVPPGRHYADERQPTAAEQAAQRQAAEAMARGGQQQQPPPPPPDMPQR